MPKLMSKYSASGLIKSLFDKGFIKQQEGVEDIVLSQDWDSNLFPSLMDFLPVNIFSLPINYKVETSYRNADIPKITNELKQYYSIAE